MAAARGTPGRAGALAIALLAGLGLGIPPADAYHTGSARSLGDTVSERVTLPINNWTGYTFPIQDGDRLIYNLTVTSGTGIDLYIVPANGLTNYASDTATRFSYFFKSENWTALTGVYLGTRENAGVTTVILDNVYFSGAEPTGNATVSVSLVREPAGLSIVVIALLVIGVVAAVAFVALLLLRRRRKPAPAMPPPSMTPPPYVGSPGPYAPPHPPAGQPPGGPPPPP